MAYQPSPNDSIPQIAAGVVISAFANDGAGNFEVNFDALGWKNFPDENYAISSSVFSLCAGIVTMGQPILLPTGFTIPFTWEPTTQTSVNFDNIVDGANPGIRFKFPQPFFGFNPNNLIFVVYGEGDNSLSCLSNVESFNWNSPTEVAADIIARGFSSLGVITPFPSYGAQAIVQQQLPDTHDRKVILHWSAIEYAAAAGGSS